ncbi:MAG TPA: hypothetical protein VFD16_02070 [Candidatus Saccharimonadales bacterium]|nr:hypothetical protein [Candidatus Saccharimonadales bacterium]
MIKPFSTLYSIILVVAFLVLATLAAVEYSGQEDEAAGVKGNAVYQVVKSSVEKVESLWAKIPTSTPEMTAETKATTTNKFWNRLGNFISFNKTDAGWQLTLQNSDRIIFQKVIILK